MTLPEKVDLLISEPFGYMLYNERMLETYLHAKKWLKPGGGFNLCLVKRLAVYSYPLVNIQYKTDYRSFNFQLINWLLGESAQHYIYGIIKAR